MKFSMKKVSGKWYSCLAIVAFLALSVMTAYNIRVGSNVTETQTSESRETSKESKDTIGNSVLSDESTQSRESKHQNEIQESETDTKAQSETQKEETQNGETRSEETQKENTDTNESEKTQKDQDSYQYDGEKTLAWPVSGNIILPYSMDTTVYYTTLDHYACNDGIMIGAVKGEEVKASADGRVVNLYETDRYGMVMTLRIGDYYEISYGQLENTQYQIGDEVKKGDVLGTVANPSRSFVLEGPNLYVKMTYKGETVNPTDYLES